MTRLINCKTCGYDINIAPRPDLVARRSSPSPPPPPRDWADRPPGSRSWLSLLNPGWKILLIICFSYICNQDACLHCSYRFGSLCQTFTFLAPFPMVWLCSAPISETILALREYWKGAATQGFVYQIGASGFSLKQLDRLGTLTPIVKPLTTKSSFGLTSS